MSDYPGGAWLTRYRERVNGDAELKVYAIGAGAWIWDQMR